MELPKYTLNAMTIYVSNLVGKKTNSATECSVRTIATECSRIHN